MISDSAALVMFAIRSAIKLGQELRQAFVDSTKRRDLVLPLPNFFSAPDLVSAANYFAAPPGSGYLARAPRLAELLQKRQTPGQTLTEEESAEVMTFYDEFFNLELTKAGRLGAANDGTMLNAEQFNALITVRQWQRGADPNPTTLQRVAGTFIEIGVDYFISVPGALNENSRQGRALAGFLEAMNQIQFSEVQLGKLPEKLLTAALDTISEHSDLLSADPKVQELVQVTTKSISTNVAARLQQLGGGDLVKAERIGDWAELVFRSVLSSAGGLVLSDPKRFLGIKEAGEGALVTSVGETVLGLVLGDSGVQLDRVFSRQGLETITKSALTVLGQHPEILVQSKNVGLQKLLAAIATQLGQYDTLLTPDMLPEITRMVLEKTGQNLSLLWPDLAKKPEQHLLLTAASTTLAILTRPPAAKQVWKLQFNTADILVVVDVVLDEIAANPTWLLDDAGQLNDNLKLALDATLTVIRNHADDRLSPRTAVQVLSAVIAKVGLRKEFLDLLPAGNAAAGQALIQATLDAIFATVFDSALDARAAWQLVRSEVIVDLVNLSLAELAKAALSSAKLAAYLAFLTQTVDALKAGGVWDPLAFAGKLEQALAA